MSMMSAILSHDPQLQVLSPVKRKNSTLLPSIRDPPPKFIENFNSRSNRFSKLDNKYAHKSCGEFLGSREHGLRRQTGGALLHRSENIISWGSSPKPDNYMPRTRSTYTSPAQHTNTETARRRRFHRSVVPPTTAYKLSTSTSCWDPDPKHTTQYKVLAETQHRLQQPNTWKYSTHADYKLSDLRKIK